MFSFLSGDIVKYVAYLAIASMLSVGAWKLYSIIKENAESAIVIETQQKTIENQKRTVELYADLYKKSDELIKQKNEEIDKLNSDIANITDNLGAGADDASSPALKEFFRRLP